MIEGRKEEKNWNKGERQKPLGEGRICATAKCGTNKYRERMIERHGMADKKNYNIATKRGKREGRNDK